MESGSVSIPFWKFTFLLCPFVPFMALCLFFEEESHFKTDLFNWLYWQEDKEGNVMTPDWLYDYLNNTMIDNNKKYKRLSIEFGDDKQPIIHWSKKGKIVGQKASYDYGPFRFIGQRQVICVFSASMTHEVDVGC